MIERFFRSPYALPLRNIQAETVASAFYSEWSAVWIYLVRGTGPFIYYKNDVRPTPKGFDKNFNGWNFFSLTSFKPVI